VSTDENEPPQASNVARALRREWPLMALALLLLGGIMAWRFRSQREASAKAAAWLGSHFAEVRRDPEMLLRLTRASNDGEWVEGYRAVAESRQETMPARFESDGRGTNDVMICANLVLHGPKDTKLAVILGRSKTDQAPNYELRAISTRRECFCDPDLVARCALR